MSILSQTDLDNNDTEKSMEHWKKMISKVFPNSEFELKAWFVFLRKKSSSRMFQIKNKKMEINN